MRFLHFFCARGRKCVGLRLWTSLAANFPPALVRHLADERGIVIVVHRRYR
jgi:hypothetical protein